MTTEKQIIVDNEYLKAEVITEKSTIIVTAVKDYITDEKFRNAFVKIGDYVKTFPTKKLIFDKSNLMTFNQNSMTWYHVEWKVEMKKYGLTTHIKILPDSTFFRKSVEVGRDNIAKNNPSFKFEDYDIQYCESIEETFKI